MRLSGAVLTACLALSWAKPAVAQPKGALSPADLLPANTIAYAELQKPGPLARECRALLKGSAVYDLPGSLAEVAAKHPEQPTYQLMPFKVLGLVFAPEVVAELSRCKGAAAAFLGVKIDKRDIRPEFVFIIEPGTSNVPDYLMRMLITVAPWELRIKETVDGVKIFRSYSTVQRKAGPGGKAPSPEVVEHDPSLAMMTDYLFIGSHQAVKDCILRAARRGRAPPWPRARTSRRR